MSDEELRRLERERERAGSGDVNVAARHLRARLRQGEVSPDRLELAALVGDPAARVVIGRDQEDVTPDELARLGSEARLRVVIALVRAGTSGWVSRFQGPDDQALAALDLFEEWARDPSPATRDAVLALRRQILEDEHRPWRLGPVLHLLGAVEGEVELLSGVEAVFGPRGDERVRRAVRREVVPWALGTGDPLRDRPRTHGVRLGHEPGMVRSVSCTPDGHVLVTTSKGGVALWALDSRTRVRELSPQRRDLYAGALSPSGRRAAVGGLAGEVAILDVDSGAALARFAPEATRDQVRDLAFLDEGRLLVAGGDGRVEAWDAARGARLFELAVADQPITAVAVAGQRIAAGARDGRVVVFEGEARVAAYDLEPSVVDLAFAPGGSLAVALERSLLLCDGATVRPLDRTDSSIYAIAVNPEGTLVGSARGDATVVLTSVATGARVHAWEELTSFPFALAFTPDGKALVGGQREGGLRTFPVP